MSDDQSSPRAAHLGGSGTGHVVHLEVLPRRATIDTPVRVLLRGLLPGQEVTLRATMTDHAGVPWASDATFAAGADGVVDPSIQAPLGGSYQGVDPMGLFWSMRPTGDTPEPALFAVLTEAPLTAVLAAEVMGEVAASAALERLIVADGLQGQDVRERGLIGRLYQPARGGPHPAVVVVGGSAAGLGWAAYVAPLLARHGHAVLALAYFGVDPLPRELIQVPLEYFDTAFDWLAARPGVRGDRLAVVGGSKGGELALLLGATFPRVRAVVAFVPSHVVHGGIGQAPGARESSWSLGGRPLPFVPRAPLDLSGQQGRSADAPLALRSSYVAALADAAAVERAAIPVERIRGGVLLVSGTEDGFWPSSEMAEQVIKRLAAHRHPYPFRHLAYAGAGHLAGGVPYLPRTVTVARHALRGLYLSFGGSPAATGASCADAWPRMVHFLDEQLKREPPG